MSRLASIAEFTLHVRLQTNNPTNPHSSSCPIQNHLTNAVAFAVATVIQRPSWIAGAQFAVRIPPVTGGADFAFLARVARLAVANAGGFAFLRAGARRTHGVAVAFCAREVGVWGRAWGAEVSRDALLAVYTRGISLEAAMIRNSLVFRAYDNYLNPLYTRLHLSARSII